MHSTFRAFFFCLLYIAATATASERGAAAAQEVLNRLLPSHSSRFRLEIVNSSEFVDRLNGAPANPELDSFARVSTPRDYYAVAALNGIVFVRGTSSVALTSGAYYYIKSVTHGQMTWGLNRTGDQLRLPDVLPDLCASLPLADRANASLGASIDGCFIRRSSTVSFRYAWNMCTFSYSAAFWDAERWQREVDWMAMHGVNFPLALTGQEYVWMKLFQDDYNVTLDALQSWLSGPAFLAWQRAGNIRGFAGPLSLHWITGQMQLQKSILAQMRGLGMTPILPCFAGHVPAVARTLWPNAKFTQSQPWNNFPENETDVWYLDPTDPAFTEIGKKFTQKLIDVFGTDHFYSCDTFNEVDPEQTDENYLKASSAAVHTSISSVDPQGVWVLQAWLFHFSFWTSDRRRVEWYLSGVENTAMIILDLNSEDGALATQFSNYHGKPWVWNMLHNYGGVRGMYGDLDTIATQPFSWLSSTGELRQSTGQIGMVGIGFTPEAIEQNPVMYELLTDTFFFTFDSSKSAPTSIPTQEWLQEYIDQRYGLTAIADVSSIGPGGQEGSSGSLPSDLSTSASASVRSFWSAWQHLYQGVYRQAGHPRSEIEWAPQWTESSFGWANGDPTHMVEALQPFLDGIAHLPSEALVTGTMLYDLVDISRQASTMFFSDMHRMYSSQGARAFEATYAWGIGNTYSPKTNKGKSLRRLGAHMLALILSLDELFSQNINFLLGVWVEDAVKWATPSDHRDVLNMIYNAKNQLTLWGPEAQINDYAAKAWAGLYRDYYSQRWGMLIGSMVDALEKQHNWSIEAFKNALLSFEESWVSTGKRFSNFTVPPKTGESAVEAALRQAQTIVDLINPCGSVPVHLGGVLFANPIIECNYTEYSDSGILPSEGQSLRRVMHVEYTVHSEQTLETSASYEYEYVRTQNIGQLMLLCALMDDCLGFTSAGVLKSCDGVQSSQCPSATTSLALLVSQMGTTSYLKSINQLVSDESGMSEDEETSLTNVGSMSASASAEAEDEGTVTASPFDADEGTGTPSSFDNESTGTPTLVDDEVTGTATLFEVDGEYTSTLSDSSNAVGDSAGSIKAARANYETALRAALVVILFAVAGVIVWALIKVRRRRAAGTALRYERTAPRETDQLDVADDDGLDDDDDDDTMQILPTPASNKRPVPFNIAARKALSYVEARQPPVASTAIAEGSIPRSSETSEAPVVIEMTDKLPSVGGAEHPV